MNDQTTTITEVKQKIRAFREERGWKKEDPKDVALSLVLESAEVLEHFQWLSGQEVSTNPAIKQAVGEELSDVLWWTVNLAAQLDIDLMAAFEEKLHKNGLKYPTDQFSPTVSQEEHNRRYYEIKAKTRGGHPLHQPVEENNT